mmetsp:Transcript_31263/g.91559  ORF Transcript_31263/g.91559 Transcript_31263/m.91559 type:complete len:386 (-) Transcript_31263:25-1182(-)
MVTIRMSRHLTLSLGLMEGRSLVVHHLGRSVHHPGCAGCVRQRLRLGVVLLKRWRVHIGVLMHLMVMLIVHLSLLTPKVHPADGAHGVVGMDEFGIPGGILDGRKSGRLLPLLGHALPLETGALGPGDGGEAGLLFPSPLALGRLILLLAVELLQVGRLAHLVEPLVGDVDLGLEVAIALPPLLILDAEDVVLCPDGFVGLHGLGEAGAGYLDHLGCLGGVLVGFLDLVLEGGVLLACDCKEASALVATLLEVLDLLHLADLQLSSFGVGEMAKGVPSAAVRRSIRVMALLCTGLGTSNVRRGSRPNLIAAFVVLFLVPVLRFVVPLVIVVLVLGPCRHGQTQSAISGVTQAKGEGQGDVGKGSSEQEDEVLVLITVLHGSTYNI